MRRITRFPIRAKEESATGKLYTAFANVATFLIAVSASFILKVGADLPFAQVLIIPLAPVLLVVKPNRLRRDRLVVIFILLGLWFFNQIVTDVYRGTIPADWMRGDARILFLTIDLLVLAILLGRNTRRQVIFLMGFAIGALLQVRLQPNEITDFWKFGYSRGTSVLVVLASCYFYRRRRYTAVVMLLLGLSALHAIFNYRSQILFVFVTIVLIVPFIPQQIGRVRILPASSRARILVQVSLALIAGQAAAGVVLLLGSQGYLGEDARAKNERQAGARSGMLLAGRPEILVSSQAVMDSPILGHGSWAKDVRYMEMLQDVQIKYGIQETEHPGYFDYIPTHSHLMGAWVEAGIFGAAFWVYITVLVIKALMRVAISTPPLAPIYAYLLIGLLWDIPFSPYGGITILPDCFLMIVLCDLLEASPRRLPVPQVLRSSTRTRQRLAGGFR